MQSFVRILMDWNLLKLLKLVELFPRSSQAHGRPACSLWRIGSYHSDLVNSLLVPIPLRHHRDSLDELVSSSFLYSIPSDLHPSLGGDSSRPLQGWLEFRLFFFLKNEILPLNRNPFGLFLFPVEIFFLKQEYETTHNLINSFVQKRWLKTKNLT